MVIMILVMILIRTWLGWLGIGMFNGYTISFNVDVSNLLLICIGVGNFLSPDVLLSNVCFYFFGGGSSLSQWVFVLFFIEQSLPSSNLVERTFKISRVDQGCRSTVCRAYEDRVEDIEWNTNVDNFWKAMKLFCEHFTIGQPNQLSWQQSITILYVTSCKTFWDSWTDQRGEIRPHFILLWTFSARLTSICGQFFVCTAVLRFCSTGHLESMGVLKILYNSVANLMPTILLATDHCTFTQDMHDLICRPITKSARRMNQNTFNPTHSWFLGVIKSDELKIIHNVHFKRSHTPRQYHVSMEMLYG